MKAGEPIRPEDLAGAKTSLIPPVVIDTFNELIAAKWSGGHAVLSQPYIVATLVERGLTRSDIFDKGWLDIEDVYRAAGWIVEYDKPGYNEMYDATFTFSKK